MNPVGRPFASLSARRRLVQIMAVLVLLAGIAQAAHFHKPELAQHNDVHLQCLLCIYSGGSAGPPVVARLVQGAAAYRPYPLPAAASIPRDAVVASYDARGPPPA
jgi:hypothetical protein